MCWVPRIAISLGPTRSSCCGTNDCHMLDSPRFITCAARNVLQTCLLRMIWFPCLLRPLCPVNTSLPAISVMVCFVPLVLAPKPLVDGQAQDLSTAVLTTNHFPRPLSLRAIASAVTIMALQLLVGPSPAPAIVLLVMAMKEVVCLWTMQLDGCFIAPNEHYQPVIPFGVSYGWNGKLLMLASKSNKSTQTMVSSTLRNFEITVLL